MERDSRPSGALLSEREMTGISVDTLKDPYLDRLVSSGVSGFAYLVTYEDKIEKVLKNGKVYNNVEASNAPKRFSGNF